MVDSILSQLLIALSLMILIGICLCFYAKTISKDNHLIPRTHVHNYTAHLSNEFDPTTPYLAAMMYDQTMQNNAHILHYSTAIDSFGDTATDFGADFGGDCGGGDGGCGGGD